MLPTAAHLLLSFQDLDEPVGYATFTRREIMDRSRVLYEGVTVGLAGAAAVAI